MVCSWHLKYCKRLLVFAADRKLFLPEIHWFPSRPTVLKRGQHVSYSNLGQWHTVPIPSHSHSEDIFIRFGPLCSIHPEIVDELLICLVIPRANPKEIPFHRNRTHHRFFMTGGSLKLLRMKTQCSWITLYPWQFRTNQRSADSDHHQLRKHLGNFSSTTKRIQDRHTWST